MQGLTKKIIYDLHTDENVVDLTNILKNIKFADDYDSQPKQQLKKFKTDQERVREIQKRTNFKDLRR